MSLSNEAIHQSNEGRLGRPLLLSDRNIRLALAIAASLALHASLITSGPAPAFVDQRGKPDKHVAEWTNSGRRSQAHVFTAVIADDSPPKEGLASNGQVVAEVPVETAAAGSTGPESGLTGTRIVNDATSVAPGPLSAKYFSTRDLDQRPEPLQQIDPEFPLTVDPGVRGSVVVRLLLDSAGQVEKVIPLRSNPPGLFDEAVIKAFADARYTPGKIGKNAVKVQLVIEVEFESPPFRQGGDKLP